MLILGLICVILSRFFYAIHTPTMSKRTMLITAIHHLWKCTIRNLPLTFHLITSDCDSGKDWLMCSLNIYALIMPSFIGKLHMQWAQSQPMSIHILTYKLPACLFSITTSHFLRVIMALKTQTRQDNNSISNDFKVRQISISKENFLSSQRSHVTLFVCRTVVMRLDLDCFQCVVLSILELNQTPLITSLRSCILNQTNLICFNFSSWCWQELAYWLLTCFVHVNTICWSCLLFGCTVSHLIVMLKSVAKNRI